MLPIRRARRSRAQIAATIYQGDHVDLYVDTPDAVSGRLMMRLAARDAAGISDIGAAIAIGISGDDAVAFPAEA